MNNIIITVSSVVVVDKIVNHFHSIDDFENCEVSVINFFCLNQLCVACANRMHKMFRIHVTIKIYLYFICIPFGDSRVNTCFTDL